MNYFLLLFLALLSLSCSSPIYKLYALCKDPCDANFRSQFDSLKPDLDLEYIYLNVSERQNFDFAVSYEMGNFDQPGLLITKDNGNKYLRTYEPLKNKNTDELQHIMSKFVQKAKNQETWFMLKGGNLFLMTRFFYVDYFLSNKMRAFVYFQGTLGILAIFYGVCCQKSKKKKQD